MRDGKDKVGCAKECHTADDISALSRRDFLRLNSALLALAVTPSCGWPGEEPEDGRSILRVVRAADLLSLRFELSNLRVVHSRNRPARLVRIDAGHDAHLAVLFSGQHVAEQTFDEADIALPVHSLLAAPSRLVFRLPPERDEVELTLASLLDWRGLIPSLPEGTSAPAANHTAIEMPYGLILSPSPAATWRHSIRPVTHEGRSEIWHTRLDSGQPGNPATVSILPPAHPARDLPGVTTSLTASDRQALTGRQAQARTLILSPMGGWLDVNGIWENDPKLTRWHHGTTAGQDQRVVVEHGDGFLYPFGHRGTLVSVTERKLQLDPASGDRGAQVALLRKRTFVAIKEPLREYVHGEMAMRELTAIDLVTPALKIESADAPCFWLETGADRPFRFRFVGKDWADRELTLDAPAMFVRESAVQNELDLQTVQDDYQRHTSRRDRQPMRGQQAAVVRFESKENPNKDRWGEPLPRERNVGDTTVQLLQLQFATNWIGTSDRAAPFSCSTPQMEVRLPSLEPYLSTEVNAGWFGLVDPDREDNTGEVFAEVPKDPEYTRIPLHFDKQADRCGGLVTPSINVAGLSRVRGPVGDTGPMYAGGRLDPSTYFHDDAAKLLGVLPLADLLKGSTDDEDDEDECKPEFPAFHFGVVRKQPDEYAENDAKPYWQIEYGLTWKVRLSEWDVGLLVFKTHPTDPCKTKLSIDVKGSKTLGGGGQKTSQQPDQSVTDMRVGSDTDQGNKKEPAGEKKDEESIASRLGLSATAKLEHFSLGMDAGAFGGITIDFHHLGINLSPGKVKKKEGKEDKKVGGLEIDYQFNSVDGHGMLLFINPLLGLAAYLPEIPNLSPGSEASNYPASIPDASSADLSLTVGPMEAPEFKLFGLEVSNANVAVGLGFNFFPQEKDAEGNLTVVPDNMLSIAVASASNPLTLVLGWAGGIAHLQYSRTLKKTVGLQLGFGVIAKREVSLGAGKAKLELTVSGIYSSFVEKKDGQENDIIQWDIVIQISGKAKLVGFVEVDIVLVAAGTWRDDVRAWKFYASLAVRIRIGFFVIRAKVEFTYIMESDDSDDDKVLTGARAVVHSAELNENEWRVYNAAFAEA